MAKLPVCELKRGWFSGRSSRLCGMLEMSGCTNFAEPYPAHTDTAQVAAKMVDRSGISAAAERGVAGKGQADKYVIELSQRFIDQKADGHLKRLPKPTTDFESTWTKLSTCTIASNPYFRTTISWDMYR